MNAPAQCCWPSIISCAVMSGSVNASSRSRPAQKPFACPGDDDARASSSFCTVASRSCISSNISNVIALRWSRAVQRDEATPSAGRSTSERVVRVTPGHRPYRLGGGAGRLPPPSPAPCARSPACAPRRRRRRCAACGCSGTSTTSGVSSETPAPPHTWIARSTTLSAIVGTTSLVTDSSSPGRAVADRSSCQAACGGDQPGLVDLRPRAWR